MTEATYPPTTAQTLAWGDVHAVEKPRSREALARLYHAHAGRLYRYFWMRTRSQALAEDLVSETFLGALRSLPGYSPARGTIGAWLFGIARHTLARHADELHRAAARVHWSGAVAANHAHAPPPPVSLDERIDLWQAVAQLSELEQEVIALHFGAGQTYSEIGRILGLQATNVGVMLYRALQRLRTWLGDEVSSDVE